METNSEIASTAQTDSVFDANPLEIAVDQLYSSNVTLANKSNIKEDFNSITNLENKDSLHGKRTRKATRKKLESLQGFSQIYQCVECPQTFTRLHQLKIHSKSHSSLRTENYKCSTCNQVINSLKSLIIHRKQCHEDTLKCPHCQLECSSKNNLRYHMKSHRGEKPYVCKECGASFSQSGHLSIHTRTHTGEKPYTCEICNNNFKQISHLKTHVRTHTHDKPYKCNQCTAAFTQNSSLKRHKRSHTGEKPYKCIYCDMTFVVKSNMQRHLNTHTGERPFQCDLCPASFGQAIDLKRHKISHTGIKPFKCDHCDAAFSRKNNLKWHKLTHSASAGYHCNVCFAGFSTTGDLKAHMRNHAPPKPFSCDICPSSFRLLDSLNRHKMIHTGGQPLRSKSSKVDINAKTSKVKPYSCMLCSASFCEKRNLKRHTLSIHHGLSDVKNENISIDRNGGTDLTTRTNFSSEQTVEKQLLVPESKQIISVDGQLCIPTEMPILPSSQQLVMQTIANQDGLSQMPQFLLAAPGQTPKPARPAGQCQNHSLHILTYVEGSYNHWQSWCFCDPPNLPEASPLVISSTSSNEINEAVTQILVSAPVHSSPSQNPAHIIMNMANTISNNQIFLNNSSEQITIPASTISTPLAVNAQPLEIQGNIITGTNAHFYKQVKSEYA